MLHAVLKFELETKGQCCKFWNNGQNIKISLKKQVSFYSDFCKSMSHFPQKLFVKKYELF